MTNPLYGALPDDGYDRPDLPNLDGPEEPAALLSWLPEPRWRSCPCCGADALPEDEPAACLVCGWAGGSPDALEQAQRSFRAFGTIRPFWGKRQKE